MKMHFKGETENIRGELIKGDLTASVEKSGVVSLTVGEESQYVNKERATVKFRKEDFKMIAKTLLMLAEVAE